MDSDFKTTVINTIKCCVGSGIIGLPFAVLSVGAGLFPIFLLFFGYISYYAIEILVEVSDHYEVPSYEDITGAVLSKYFHNESSGRRLGALGIFIATTVSTLGYLFIVKSQVPEVLKFTMLALGYPCKDQSYWLFNGNYMVYLVTALVLIPIGFTKNMAFLRYSSVIGMAAVVFCVVIVIGMYTKISCPAVISAYSVVDLGNNRCNYTPNNSTLRDWRDFQSSLSQMSKFNETSLRCETRILPDMADSSRFVDGIHNLIYALYVHDAIMSVYAELKDRSRARMMKVCKASFAVVLVLYALFAYFGYLTWYDATVAEIFLTYSHGYNDNVFIFFGRMAIVVSALTTGMIAHYAARKAFSMFFFSSYELVNTEEEGSEGAAKETSQQRIVRYGFPIMYYGSCAILVASTQSLQTIFSWGGLVATAMYIVVPPLLWLLTFYADENTPRKSTIAKAALLIFGSALLAYEFISLLA